MPFLTTALAVGAIASGVAGAGASIYGASKQASAAKSAAELQHEDQQASLDFQKQEWQTQQTNEAPFLKAGQGAIGELSNLISTPGQGLLTPWTDTFKAPTAEEARQTPGYEFAVNQGEDALQKSAAASGGLLTGGTLKGINNYAEGMADTNYQNVFNNALTQYQTAYNTFQNNQTNTYNRLAGVAGTGQTAASTLGSEGAAASGNVTNINATGGAQVGGSLENAAFQSASGYAGAANALSGTVGSLSSLTLLQQLLKQQQQPGNPPIDMNNPADAATGLWT